MPQHSTHVTLHHGAPTSNRAVRVRFVASRLTVHGKTRFDRTSESVNRNPRIFSRTQIAVLKLSAAIGSCQNRRNGETVYMRTCRLLSVIGLVYSVAPFAHVRRRDWPANASPPISSAVADAPGKWLAANVRPRYVGMEVY